MARQPPQLVEQQRALGRHLAEFREAAGLYQVDIARAVPCHRTTVTHAEAGSQLPGSPFWEAVDKAVGANGALLADYDAVIQAREAHRAEQQARRRARAQPSQQADAGRLRSGQDATPTLISSDVADGVSSLTVPNRPDQPMLLTAPPEHVIAYLREQWHLLVRADNLFGPARVLRLVHAQIELIESTLRHVPNRFRASLLSLGAEYAESAAWLHEDAGEPIATFWTGRALEWAHAAEDDRLVAWALFRRSQQVSSERDAAQAIGLARAAQGMGAYLSDQMRAAITQQEACGLVLDGDEAACQRKLDEALEWAAADDVQGDARSGHGAFCTASYIELRRAECWLTLGRPERAVPTYKTALAGLPDAYNRDRGHGLAQLAGALVAIDEPEHAAGVASEALIIASGCGSGRTLRHIQTIGSELRRHAKLPRSRSYSITSLRQTSNGLTR